MVTEDNRWHELVMEQRLQEFQEDINRELQRLYSGNNKISSTQVVVRRHEYFDYDQTLFTIFIFLTEGGSYDFSFCMLNDTLYGTDAKSNVNRIKAVKQIKYYKNTILPYPRQLGIR